jgi:hypothetical protein
MKTPLIIKAVGDVDISLTEDEWSLMTDQKLNRLLGKEVSPPEKSAKKVPPKKKVS